MTMKLKGRKARLYATAMAISLVAMSGAAHAASANGAYKKGSWTVTKEAKVNKPPVALTADAQAKLDSVANAKTSVKDQALAGLDQTAVTGTSVRYTEYKSAVTALKTAQGTGATGLATRTTELATAQKNKADSDALVAKLTAEKATADASVTSTAAAVVAANAAKAALVSPTTAQTAAADAVILQATVASNVAIAAADDITTAFNTATNAGTRTGYSTAVSTAETNLLAAQQSVASLQVALTDATNVLTTRLATDAGFARTLTAVNGAAGTTFAASVEGLTAIEAYNAAPAAEQYASNGFTRATNFLAAAAASSNQSISLASGALTESAAALEVGANFETEVLGALVDHETRITSNTTAIAALDVRTTANTTAIATNTTAIAALDVRTTANTTAITAANTAIANEVTARVAADNALGARITAETDARIAADNVLRDQIASSTATAIAMGGAALLPDMGFTLSGNVAFYEGAQAIALNAAAKVGPNAYATASVGGGLNKNGSLGGRVGFVIGF